MDAEKPAQREIENVPKRERQMACMIKTEPKIRKHEARPDEIDLSERNTIDGDESAEWKPNGVNLRRVKSSRKTCALTNETGISRVCEKMKEFEYRFLREKFTHVIGADEAGRGPLAGPVVAGAFLFKLSQAASSSSRHDEQASQSDSKDDSRADLMKFSFPRFSFYPWTRITDSKQINEETREELYDLLTLQGQEENYERTRSRPLEEELDSPKVGPWRNKIGNGRDGDGRDGDGKNGSYRYAWALGTVEEIDEVNILESSLNCMTRSSFRLMLDLLNYPSTETANETKDKDKDKDKDKVKAKKDYSTEIRVKVLVDGNKVPWMLKHHKSGEVICNHDGGGGCECLRTSGLKMEELRFLENFASWSCEAIVKGDDKVLSIGAASIIAKVKRDRIIREMALKYPGYDLEQNKGYPTPSHKAQVSKIGCSKIHRLSFEPCFSILKQKLHPIPEGRDFEFVVAIKETAKLRAKLKAKETKKTSNTKNTRNNKENGKKKDNGKKQTSLRLEQMFHRDKPVLESSGSAGELEAPDPNPVSYSIGLSQESHSEEEEFLSVVSTAGSVGKGSEVNSERARKRARQNIDRKKVKKFRDDLGTDQQADELVD